MNMNTPHWSVARWVLIAFWLVTSLQRSDAIRWTKQPEKPTILEEGRTLVHLVWKFLIEGTSEGAEILRGVTFRRQRDAGDSPVVIASNRNGGAFTVFPQFRSNYNAIVPATLILLRAVANEPDFIYSIEVSFLRNNLPQPEFRDAVQVIVRARSCISYFVLEGSDRNVANTDQKNLRCDQRDLIMGGYTDWYRFKGAAGIRIPTFCVPTRRCGTHAPGWLNGSHPSVREGIVTRRVCYHWGSNCCYWKNDIQIQNCGAFYVYRLVKPPQCYLRYCAHNQTLSTSPTPSIITASPASTQFPVSSVSFPVYGGVRLVGGNWSGEGRVEIYYRGSWGTVCDDDWDIRDARVVCRQLGYPSAVSAPHRARFGQGNGTIWLDNVQCQGYESSIVNCNHSSWGVHNCGHSEDASVVCSNYSIPLPSASSVSPTAASTQFPVSSVSLPVYGDVRLVGGNWSGEGRVEVYFRGSWGTACDDRWDIRDARVVCRQLGYSSAVSAPKRAHFGQGTGIIWLSQVSCQGDESSIMSCSYYPKGVQVCSHRDDASVICSRVRLAGGNWSGEGRVEIYYRGSWGTVCDDYWDINDARVVCRELGYPSAVSAPLSARFGNGTGRIWLDDVQCQGNESSILNCNHSSWGVHNCGHHEDASVVCSNYSIPFPSASSVSPAAATPTPRPSPTRPRFAFTISCFPSAMVAYIARDSLPLGSDPRLLHLNNPSCGLNYVTKKSVIIKAPLKGCGTVRRNIGYKVSFHNKLVVPFGYGNKRSLSVYPFKCVYSHFGFP